MPTSSGRSFKFRCAFHFVYKKKPFILQFFFPSFPTLFFFLKKNTMGFLSALDAIAHGGIQQPESYVKKKNYVFEQELGNKMGRIKQTWRRELTMDTTG